MDKTYHRNGPTLELAKKNFRITMANIFKKVGEKSEKIYEKREFHQVNGICKKESNQILGAKYSTWN